MKLLGLVGAKGAGKKHFANIAVRHCGEANTRIFSYEKVLYSEIENAFFIDQAIFSNLAIIDTPLTKLSLQMCTDHAFVEFVQHLHENGLDLVAPRSPRWICVHWANHYRRDYDRDYWLKWFGWAFRQALLDNIQLMICTDLRRHEEIRAVEILSGKILAIRNKRAEENAPLREVEAIWLTHLNRIDLVNPFPLSIQGEFEHTAKAFLDRLMGR